MAGVSPPEEDGRVGKAAGSGLHSYFARRVKSGLVPHRRTAAGKLADEVPPPHETDGAQTATESAVTSQGRWRSRVRAPGR